MPASRKLALAGLLFGLAALAFIVWRVGVGPVLAAMATIGWGFLLILALRLLLETATGMCWWVLGAGLRLPPFAWARLIRDSASECLPLSQIGGFVLGARALTVAGVDGAVSTASLVVDVTLELIAQLFYLLLGLFLLWRTHPEFPLLRPLLFGLAGLTVGALGLLALQSRGAGLVERLSARLLRSWSGAQAGTRAVLAEIAVIHASRPRIIAGTIGHLACWVFNGLEAWLILSLMGSPVTVVTALIIDSLLYGLRSFAFMIPNGLGVQEAGYVLLGGLFGLSPQTCIALSLLRRARDLALGVPALATWQAMEGRRAWGKQGRGAWGKQGRGAWGKQGRGAWGKQGRGAAPNPAEGQPPLGSP